MRKRWLPWFVLGGLAGLVPGPSVAQTPMVTSEIVCGDCVGGCPLDSECSIDGPPFQLPGPTTRIADLCQDYCTARRGHCSPNSVPCTDDSDCLAGESCEGGICREPTEGYALGAPCNHDEQCRSWLACRNGECGYGECTIDADCPIGVCSGSSCVLPEDPVECRADSDCDGQVCTGGRCEPCHCNAECAEGRVCGEDGTCTACATDEQCDRGFDCDSSLGLCVESGRTTCGTRADCPPTQACLDGLCGPCTMSSQCGEGSICLREIGNEASAGQCRTLQPWCSSDSNCPPDHRCEAGLCAPRCDEGERWIVDPEGGRGQGWCVDRQTPRCGSDRDCGFVPGTHCVEGFCVD